MMYGPVAVCTSGEQHGDAGGQSALDAQLGRQAVTPISVMHVSLVAQHAVPHCCAAGQADTHACVVPSQTVPLAQVQGLPQPLSPHAVPLQWGVQATHEPALQLCPVGQGQRAEQPAPQPASTKRMPASFPAQTQLP